MCLCVDIDSYEEYQAMRGSIDVDRNATGQKVLCQTRLMEMVNRHLVDMDQLRTSWVRGRQRDDGKKPNDVKKTSRWKTNNKTSHLARMKAAIASQAGRCL